MKDSLGPDRYKPRPPYDWDEAHDPFDPAEEWNKPVDALEHGFWIGASAGATIGALVTLLILWLLR